MKCDDSSLSLSPFTSIIHQHHHRSGSGNTTASSLRRRRERGNRSLHEVILPHLPRMLPASHPLLYACVFRDTALVADLAGTSADRAGLPALAASLVAGAPPHHRYLTHSAGGRAHALLLAPPLALAAVSLAPQLPAAQLLLLLRRLRCLPEDRMHDEMPRLALRLPLPPDDEGALAREAEEVAEAEEAARRDAEIAARRTPKREGRRATPAWTWRRQLWMVIIVDLVLLCVLFGAWLAVCRGFSCIGR